MEGIKDIEVDDCDEEDSKGDAFDSSLKDCKYLLNKIKVLCDCVLHTHKFIQIYR